MVVHEQVTLLTPFIVQRPFCPLDSAFLLLFQRGPASVVCGSNGDEDPLLRPLLRENRLHPADLITVQGAVMRPHICNRRCEGKLSWWEPWRRVSLVLVCNCSPWASYRPYHSREMQGLRASSCFRPRATSSASWQVCLANFEHEACIRFVLGTARR